MRRLPRPNLDYAEVYSTCIDATYNEPDSQPYTAARDGMVTNADLYRERAQRHALFQFQASKRANYDQLSFGQLTKGGLNALYSKGLVASSKGRPFYDKILAIAPLGKCPYCQFGQVETLDHFLPKARYPSLAVVPDNLVPACMRCNKGKGSGVFSENDALSHPYFEDERIQNEDWLYAEVSPTKPVTIRFFVTCPTAWPIDLKKRVSNYFRDFDLAKRYSIEAASELVSISAYVTDLISPTLRLEHLNRVARLERTLSRNGWKTALYQALANSNWYNNEGLVGTGLQQT